MVQLIDLAEARGRTLSLRGSFGKDANVRGLGFVGLTEKHNLLIIGRHLATTLFVLLIKVLAPSQSQWLPALMGNLHLLQLLAQ